jgi:hypothetical protein
MDVCVCFYSVFVLSCVQAAALRRADHSLEESYRLCKNYYRTEEETGAQQRGVEQLINERKETVYAGLNTKLGRRIEFCLRS